MLDLFSLQLQLVKIAADYENELQEITMTVSIPWKKINELLLSTKINGTQGL